MAEAGLAVLCFAAALAVPQLMLSAVGIHQQRADLMAAVRPVAVVQGLLAGLAMTLLWWKPFVTLIWLGGVLIAIGGALSLLDRMKREARGAQRAVAA